MILVTGATGLLGRAVYDAFKQANEDVVGTCFSRSKPGLIPLDLNDSEAVLGVFETVKPSIVIHCAAERRPDVAAKNEAGTLALNVQVPRLLSKLCQASNAWFLYISSDAVFDGTSPPYQVDSPTNPLNFYGQTKLGGETASLEYNGVVLRIPLLYGLTQSNGECSVTSLIDTVLLKQACKVDHLTIRVPTCVDDVAATILLMTRAVQQGQVVSGIYHYSAHQELTKLDMCHIFGKLFNVDTSFLIPDLEQPSPPAASRPVNPKLCTDRLQQEGLYASPIAFMNWFSSHLDHFQDESTA